MSVLVTPENIFFFFFLQYTGMATFFILPKAVFLLLTWMQRAEKKKNSSFWGQGHLEGLRWEQERGHDAAFWRNDLPLPQCSQSKDFQARDLVVG